MAKRELLSGSITLSDAQSRESNILHALGYPKQKAAFYQLLESKRHLIQAVVAHHLGVSHHACHVSDQEHWLHGSFNLCVPVVVSNWRYQAQRPLIIRFPLPYRVGEASYPGNADEKLRCEAGAYAWLQVNCPSIPIPELYGFGLSTGQKFTALDHLPGLSRCFQRLYRYIMSWLGYSPSSRYVCHGGRGSQLSDFDIGYLLVERIEPLEGQMLSNTWRDKCGDERLRTNLYRGLSRILLALARVPLPRIGAFRLDSQGCLRLDNRPLSFDFVTLENEGIPLDISRDTTYSTVDSFILDLLSTFDSRLVHQPNGVSSADDAYFQAAGLAAARAVLPQILRRDLRHGPFTFNLTDLHQSNIFVDDDWNIVKVLDLEFSCSYPLEFQQPPYWLSGQGVDEIDEERYGRHHARFLEVLEEEERQCEGGEGTLSSTIRKGWKSGAFWVSHAVTSPTAFTTLFYHRILPFLGLSKDMDAACYHVLAKLWQPDSFQTIKRKISDLKTYERELEDAFGEGQ